MKHKVLFTILVFIFSLNTYSVLGQSSVEDILVKIDDKLLKKYSGSFYAKDESQAEIEYYSVNKQEKIDNTTSFYLASLSKQFTAIAILKLVEEEKLRLTDSLNHFFDNIPTDKKDITIHQLLTHTAGLGDHFAADGISNSKTAYNTILNKPLKSKPNEKYFYTNDAYNLLAIIIEKVSKKTFESYLMEHMIIPLGMKNTALTSDNAQWKKLKVANNYFRGKKNKNPQYWKSDWGQKGATGVISTISDLKIWFNAILENKIISKKYVELLFMPHAKKADDVYYGYGWNIIYPNSDKEVITHSGQDDVFSHTSTLRYYTNTKELYIALSNNSKNYKNRTFSRAIVKEITNRN